MIFCACFLYNFNDCSGTTADMTHSDSTKTMGEIIGEISPIISPIIFYSHLEKAVNFNSPTFYNFVFKNVSPLGFMIEVFIKKPGLRGGSLGQKPPKNEVHTGFTPIYSYLSKVLEDDFLFRK